MGESVADRKIGSYLGSRRTHGYSCFTRDGFARRTAIPELSWLLNRAKWSSRALSGIILHLLVKIFMPSDTSIVVGIDETMEKRRGRKIAANGIYHDPV